MVKPTGARTSIAFSIGGQSFQMGGVNPPICRTTRRSRRPISLHSSLDRWHLEGYTGASQVTILNPITL